jgi:uncharacterized protein YggU (UPF0235/DUF167 family)
MKIVVTVRPRSKTERVVRTDDTHFSVWVKEPPVDDRANEAAVAALAKHLSIPRRQVRLIYGNASRLKIFEIPPLAAFER